MSGIRRRGHAHWQHGGQAGRSFILIGRNGWHRHPPVPGRADIVRGHGGIAGVLGNGRLGAHSGSTVDQVARSLGAALGSAGTTRAEASGKTYRVRQPRAIRALTGPEDG